MRLILTLTFNVCVLVFEGEIVANVEEEGDGCTNGDYSEDDEEDEVLRPRLGPLISGSGRRPS